MLLYHMLYRNFKKKLVNIDCLLDAYLSFAKKAEPIEMPLRETVPGGPNESCIR